MVDQPLNQRLREIKEAEQLQSDEPGAEAPPEPRRRAPLGRLLVEKGLLTETALDQALEQQRESGRPLGQILLELGAISPGDLARALTEQHGFEFSGSLRARLATGENASATLDASDHERYVVFDTDPLDPLHVADTFLDAADAAFDLIEDGDHQSLQIARSRDGEFEHVWSYRPDEPAPTPSV